MRIILAFWLLLAAAPALAQPPLLAPPPGLDAAGQAGWQRFLSQNHPRAFALSPDGKWGAAWGGPTDEAAGNALANCRRGSPSCAIYARDSAIEWPGRAWRPPSPPARFSGGMAYDIIPDPRFLYWGPAAAQGVFVWGHGRGSGDSRGAQPQPYTRWFNNAGYDVMRFDRHPNSDEPDRAAAWLRESLTALRAAGYKRIVVGGQSRGGWNALMMLAHPGLADGVVAMAPARHGDGAIGNANYPRATADFRELMEKASDPRARTVIAGFQGDNFIPDPDARSALVNQLLPSRVGRVLWLDRPAGITGHGGGNTWQFNDRFGGCIFRFVTAANPPAAC
jgi:hypothetical protein